MYSPKKRKKIFLFSLDAFSICIIFAICSSKFEDQQSIIFWAVWVSATLGCLYLSGRYSFLSSQADKVRHSFRSFGWIIPSFFVSYPFMNGQDTFRVGFTCVLFITTVLILIFSKYVWIQIVRRFKLDKSTIILLRSSSDSINGHRGLLKYLENEQVSIEEISVNNPTELKSICFSKCDRVVYGSGLLEHQWIANRFLRERIEGVDLIDLPSFYAQMTGRIPLELVDEKMLLNSSTFLIHNRFFTRLIRCMDLFVGLILFGLFLIPGIAIGILIKFESEGPLIFKQERVGKNLKPFTLYKFRSMGQDAEKNGPQWASVDDIRVTKVGSFLRKTHLDELPQIFNILRGDLGLVGPRPIRLHFAEILEKKFPMYNLRFLVKPGLTGWTQIKGPYGEDEAQHRVKLEMDLYYLQNANLFMNLYILMGTGKHIIFPSENSHALNSMGFVR